LYEGGSPEVEAQTGTTKKATYLAIGRRVREYKTVLKTLTGNQDPPLQERPPAPDPKTPPGNRSMLSLQACQRLKSTGISPRSLQNSNKLAASSMALPRSQRLSIRAFSKDYSLCEGHFQRKAILVEIRSIIESIDQNITEIRSTLATLCCCLD
jgi:hypothetical protein